MPDIGIKRVSRISRQNRLSFYIFISPWIFGFLLFQIMPIVWGVSISLTNQMAFTVNRKFIGFQNHIKLLSDPNILYAFLTTFIYTISSTCLAVITCFIIALLLEREVFGRGVFRTILYFPYMIPLIAVGWIFKIFLDRDTGFFNIVLTKLGLISANIPWLSQFPRESIVSLALWMSGWSMIIFLGGLSTIPSELYEVARIDGAGRFQIFFRVMFPLVQTAVIIAAIFAFQWSWSNYLMPVLFLRGEKVNLAVKLANGYTDIKQNILHNIGMAGIVYYTLPIVIVFFALQKRFIAGLLSCGLKG